MDIQKLTIGQMATLNHVTTQTLRHYDRMGIISPWITDPHSGYRYYHINQSARLDMIQSLQSHGISLQKIKEHLDLSEYNHEATLHMLKKQLDVISEDMARLAQSKNTITRMISNYEKYKNLPGGGAIFLEYIPRRRIFTCKTGINFFEREDVGYEFMLRELRQSVLLCNLPVGNFFNAGTLVRKRHLDTGTLHSDEVFLFLDDNYEGPGVIEEIPPSLYLCLCAQVFADEATYAHKLIQAVSEGGYEISGDYISEIILDFPGFAASPRNTFCKIQIPVNRS